MLRLVMNQMLAHRSFRLGPPGGESHLQLQVV